LKYIVALLSKPEVLFLDEPTSNLDEAGLELVDAICEEQKKRGILVVATNDKRDFKYGEKIIRLPGRGSRSTD
jgi:heme exporter protein A